MSYQDLPAVRKKLSENIRKDIEGVSKAQADRMAERAVRRGAEQIERQVREGTRSGR